MGSYPGWDQVRVGSRSGALKFCYLLRIFLSGPGGITSGSLLLFVCPRSPMYGELSQIFLRSTKRRTLLDSVPNGGLEYT